MFNLYTSTFLFLKAFAVYKNYKMCTFLKFDHAAHIILKLVFFI